MLLRTIALTVTLASISSTAAAQMSLVRHDRAVEMRASTYGGSTPIENTLTVTAPDDGEFLVDQTIQAMGPLGSGTSTGRQHSRLLPDRIFGSGHPNASSSAAWDTQAFGSASSGSEMGVVFDLAQPVTYTLTGALQFYTNIGVSGPAVALLDAFGTTIFLHGQNSNGTLTLQSSGVLAPGRYTFTAHAASVASSVMVGFWGYVSSFDFEFVVEPLFTNYCFGDGTGTACPCGNSSPAGAEAGCANSLGQGGALRATGMPSIANDTLVLQGTQMTNGSALYFQGTQQVNGGNGAVFGDGKRCASGAIARLGTKTNAAGASQYPDGADQSVSLRGAVGAPGTRTYQVWYRNVASFCTADGFNLTNGLAVEWQP